MAEMQYKQNLHLWKGNWILAARLQQQPMFTLLESLLHVDNRLKTNHITVNITRNFNMKVGAGVRAWGKYW